MLDWLKSIDTELLLKINSLHSDFLDKIMWQISGQVMWIPFFALIVFLFFKKCKKQAFIALIFLIFAVGLSDFVSVHAFKEVFKRLRPTHNPAIENIVHIVNNYRGGNYGFVSSHAATFFSLSMFSSLIIKNKYFTILAFLIAAIIAYSRMYLGVHYPGDILGGAILGIIMSFITYQIYKRIFNQKTKQAQE